MTLGVLALLPSKTSRESYAASLRYFLEIQHHRIDREQPINTLLLKHMPPAGAKHRLRVPVKSGSWNSQTPESV